MLQLDTYQKLTQIVQRDAVHLAVFVSAVVAGKRYLAVWYNFIHILP
jgi:hypothetical protein